MLRADSCLHGVRAAGEALDRGLLLRPTLLRPRREAPSEGAKPCEPARQLKVARSGSLCLVMLLCLIRARRMLATAVRDHEIAIKCDAPDPGNRTVFSRAQKHLN
jgi:hypothetical protein